MFNHKYTLKRPAWKTQESYSPVDEAKKFPIERLYQGKLRQTGKTKMGICPWHEETTPSFAIYPNNTWYCFGEGIGGDVIAYYMKLTGKSFPEAIEELRHDI